MLRRKLLAHLCPLLLCSALSSCVEYAYTVDGISSVGSVASNESSEVDAPTGLELISPSESSSLIDTPTIRVQGVNSGDTVKLFSDSTCLNEIGEGTSTGESIDITTSDLIIANYTIYASTTSSGGVTSSCSSASLNYTCLLYTSDAADES